LRSDLSSRSLELLPLEPDYYAQSTLVVAPDLLGKILFARKKVRGREEVVAGRIVETEAYRSDDPASHSCKGKTPRASIMFGDPGVAYVYFIYGMYEMLNFVTEPHGEAGAVLIRGLEPILGEDLMKKRRKTARTRRDLTAGPGKLCRALGIEMSQNGSSLQGPQVGSDLWVVDDGFKPGKIRVSPRIGISQGQDKLWRYYIEGNSFVSRSPMNQRSLSFKGKRIAK
jgi:DNA-3-methyladenine glycosylase